MLISNIFVSLSDGITTFVDYFNAKAIFVEEQQWYYLNHTFYNVISWKMNAIARLEFELTNFEATVLYFCYERHGDSP